MPVLHDNWEHLQCFINKDIDLSHTRVRQLNEYGLLCISFVGVSYFSFLMYVYSNTPKVVALERKKSHFISQLNRSAKGRTSPYKKLAVKLRDSLTATI